MLPVLAWKQCINSRYKKHFWAPIAVNRYKIEPGYIPVTARCVNCSKLTKKTHQNDLTDIGILRNVDFAVMFSLVTLKRFHTFSQDFTVEFGECYRLGLPTEIKVQTSKNYEICKGRCKSYINQTDQTTTWKETCVEF